LRNEHGARTLFDVSLKHPEPTQSASALTMNTIKHMARYNMYENLYRDGDWGHMVNMDIHLGLC
jgi:hypothetical protein